MSDSDKKIKFKWLEKLKNVKHIEIYIAVIFVVVLLLIYLSSAQTSSSGSKANKSSSEITVAEYVNDLETNLEQVLSNIGGVSNVKVLITLDMQQVSVEDSKICINTFPPVKGIIITAKGLNDTARRLKVLRAVEAVVDITNGNIEILSSE